LRLSLVAPLIVTWVSFLLFLERREMRISAVNRRSAALEACFSQPRVIE
jgi:hypothetical protein